MLSTVIIRLSSEKLDLEERGLIREGEGLFKSQENMLQKGLRKVLMYQNNELDKMAIKLNRMKLDIGVIMQKNYSKELLTNSFSVLTASGRILDGAY